MSEDDDGILRPDFTSKTSLSIKKTPWMRKCKHRHVTIDESTRTVECSDCSVALSAFEVLLQFATEERTIRYHLGQLKEITERVEELKKEERRIKQRIARARKKVE